MMAHVVGYTNVDDSGQEGIELAWQKSLAGLAGSRRVIRNRLNQPIEDVDAASIRAPHDGADLTLSVDSRLQYLAFTELKKAVDLHRAKAGAIVVLDVRTGEVLALANLPTYDPNDRRRMTGEQLRNRVLTDTYEPGSTLKPFTISLALDRGVVKPGASIMGTLSGGGTQVISVATAREMRQMLEMAAGPGGTAPKAQVMGYRVAGKTGTAHKLGAHGRYDGNRYVGSFVGFAPVSNPRIVVAVMIDEPSNGVHYGGDVAAPVFSAVVGGALRTLNVEPDSPIKSLIIPADSPKEAL